MFHIFKPKRFLTVLSLLLLTLSFAASAQRANGNIGGNAAPGDQIAIQSSDTGFSRQATADKEGRYRFGSLPLGQYLVTITRGGIPVLKTAVQVRPGGTARPPTPQIDAPATPEPPSAPPAN